jgi:HAD superfamily hydrolase (TIGR01509 family)
VIDLQLVIFDCDGVLVDSEAISNRERARAFRRELKPVQGAAESVESIRAAGVAVCVASQGKRERTRLSLELTGLGRLFPTHARFSAESVVRGKPHPDLFLYAAATMGAEPARCVVIEDTPSGITAAIAAGMRALGYIADSDEAALRAAGAERLGMLDELQKMLGLE